MDVVAFRAVRFPEFARGESFSGEPARPQLGSDAPEREAEIGCCLPLSESMERVQEAAQRAISELQQILNRAAGEVLLASRRFRHLTSRLIARSTGAMGRGAARIRRELRALIDLVERIATALRRLIPVFDALLHYPIFTDQPWRGDSKSEDPSPFSHSDWRWKLESALTDIFMGLESIAGLSTWAPQTQRQRNEVIAAEESEEGDEAFYAAIGSAPDGQMPIHELAREQLHANNSDVNFKRLGALQADLNKAETTRRAKIAHIDKRPLKSKDRQKAMREATISYDRKYAAYLKGRGQINAWLYAKARQAHAKGSLSERDWVDLRQGLMEDERQVDLRLSEVASRAWLIEAEIGERVVRSKKSQFDYLNDQSDLLQMLLQVQEIEELSFDALKRERILAAASRVQNRPVKPSIQAEVLFDLPRLSGILEQIRSLELKESDSVAAIARQLAAESGFEVSTVRALWNLAQEARGTALEEQLDSALTATAPERVGSVTESYRLASDAHPNIAEWIQPLPSWVERVEARAAQLLADFSLNERGKRAKMRELMREIWVEQMQIRQTQHPELKPRLTHLERLMFIEGQKYVSSLTANSMRPTAMTKSQRAYFGGFELERRYPSRVFYYASDESAVRARALHFCESDYKVMFIGGMGNFQPENYEKHLASISQFHGGRTVEAIYNSCGGIFEDLGEAINGRTGMAVTPPVLLIAQAIRRNLGHSQRGLIHIIAHSQGCIHLKNALIELEPNERARLVITAVGPGAHIPRDLSPDATHIASTRDWVAVSSLPRRADRRVKWLLPADGANTAFDHAFASATYQTGIRAACEGFLEAFKKLNPKNTAKKLRKKASPRV